MTLSPAIPAATLVVFRDTAPGPPELLMVERSRAMAFAGGALVFPGGRIDPGDVALAAAIAPGCEDGAARIAAIRETIEEAGVAIGLSPASDVAAIRGSLAAGAALGEAIGGGDLDLEALVAFARWRPAHLHSRIFDTRFYLARLPAGAVPASVDATENTRLAWMTARRVLGDADAGVASIIYPTRRNLERLAAFADFDEAVADATAHPVRTIVPFTDTRDGVEHLCIPDDMGYPVTSEPMTTAVRG